MTGTDLEAAIAARVSCVLEANAASGEASPQELSAEQRAQVAGGQILRTGPTVGLLPLELA